MIHMVAFAVPLSSLMAQSVKRPEADSLLRVVARRGEDRPQLDAVLQNSTVRRAISIRQNSSMPGSSLNQAKAISYTNRPVCYGSVVRERRTIPGEKSRAAAAVAAGSL
jgi:hypothetical protein